MGTTRNPFVTRKTRIWNKSTGTKESHLPKPSGGNQCARHRRRMVVVKTICMIFALIACTYGVLSAAPAPKEAPNTNPALAPLSGNGTYLQVDRSSAFFNEGKYLNQTEQHSDTPFTEHDFEVTGGHMKKLKPSSNSENGSIYEQCAIWPNLVNEQQGIPGWAFIADNTYEKAEGAQVSMRYQKVGTLEDAANASAEAGPLVDIKVTYRIAKAAPESKTHGVAVHPDFKFDGHPAIHVTDNFSYGVFQFGIEAMETVFEFFRHGTDEKLDIDSIYYTNTSQDKGEGVAIDPEQVASSPDKPGVWLSKDAPDLTSPNVHPACQFKAIPGTRVYEGGHCDQANGKVCFVGVPQIFAAEANPSDYPHVWPSPELNYVDTIGDDSYYWRSTCYLLKLDESSRLTLTKIATGYTDWTTDEGFDIEDRANYQNGGSCYSTHNFLPLTNPSPKAPHKTINGSDETVSDVGIGDTVHYEITQPIHNLGGDGMVKYHAMKLTDPLPAFVTYKEGSAEVTDTLGNPLDTDSFAVSYDADTHTLIIDIAEDYLQNKLAYDGGALTFKFDVSVIDQPDNAQETVKNSATVQINELSQQTNTVEYLSIPPQLAIVKESTVKDCYAVGEEATYKLTVTNIVPGSLAKDVQIDDGFTTVKNNAAEIVENSIEVFDAQNNKIDVAPEQITYTRNESNAISGFSLDTNHNLAAKEKFSVHYRVKYLSNNEGQVLTNVANTWALNAAKVSAEHSIRPEEAKQPDLVVEKTSDKQTYACGETGTYTHHITNSSDTTATNIRIHDEIDSDARGVAEVVKGTVLLRDHNGNNMPCDKITYLNSDDERIYGFDIETGCDLAPNDAIDVTYQVRFGNVAQNTLVINSVWASADNAEKAQAEARATIERAATPEKPKRPDGKHLGKTGDYALWSLPLFIAIVTIATFVALKRQTH